MAILQLKISLKDVSPPFWRRILVEDNTTFDKLHNIIQVVMDWGNNHMYAFFVNRLEIGIPEDICECDFDSRQTSLSKCLHSEKQTLKYIYDFSNDKEHKIIIEKILKKDPSVKYPVSIKGKRLSLPEIYEDPFVDEYFSETADDQNQGHETDNETLDSIEDETDPEEFDKSYIDYINKQLSKLQ